MDMCVKYYQNLRRISKSITLDNGKVLVDGRLTQIRAATIITLMEDNSDCSRSKQHKLLVARYKEDGE